MFFTVSAKLYNAASAVDGTGVEASERMLTSCKNSRLSSNNSESAGDKGADGIVGAALHDIVEPHGDSGPVHPAHAARTINYVHQPFKVVLFTNNPEMTYNERGEQNVKPHYTITTL